MNLRSTTPVIKRFAALSFVAILFLLIISSNSPVHADQLQDKINQIQQQIDDYQSQAEKLSHDANSLQAAIDELQAQQNVIQSQIDLSQAKHDQLVQQIKDTEAKIIRNQEVLGETIANLYVSSKVTPVEMLASSKNIGDYLDQQEFRSSVRDQVEDAIKEIKTLKKSLEEKKVAVEKVLADQKSQINQLAEKKQEQARLLNITRGEEAVYAGLVGSFKEQRKAAEAALARSLSSGSYKVSPVGAVGVGDVVGSVGNTGLSTGAHLHLEVRTGGGVTNPGPYIKTNPIDMPPGYISQEYGNSDPIYARGSHPGIDYASSSGSAIYAIDGGQLYRGCSSQMFGTDAYGYVAVVEHSNGTKSIYGHMSGGPPECNYNTYR